MGAVSPRDDAKPPRPDREGSGGKVVAAVIGGLALLAGGGYAALALTAGDKVPRGTAVSGVDIGGRTQADAVAALEEGLAERESGRLRVSVAGSDAEPLRLSPADAGLSVDHLASVEAAGGERTWDPRRLWDYYTGGDDLEAVVDVDPAALDALVTRLDDEAGAPAVDGEVVFGPAGVSTVSPQQGRALDAEEVREALEAAYVAERRADRRVELEPVVVEPDIDAADVQAGLDDFANPALSASVVLRFDGTPLRLQPADYREALSMEPVDGELEPRVDTEALSALVDSMTTSDDPVDATVALVDGRPQVVPGRPGVSYDPDDVAADFLDVLTRREGRREVDVEATVARPDFTTKDARALGIRERVSSFTTYFPYAEYRNVNIGRAAEIVDGTVVKPGETFSLNDIVGERTVENGFTTGTIISDGVFVEDLGGGVSQMATTTYNAAFFAGLEDVEHKAHSVYIDRYPVGREATVVWGAVDLRFRNDTDHGVLVDTAFSDSTPSSQGVLTVSIWSTKTWDITTRTSERYDYTAPATQTLRTENCLPNTGYSGFSVDVWRYFRRPGEEQLVKQEKIHTDYIPSDTIICRPPAGAGRG